MHPRSDDDVFEGDDPEWLEPEDCTDEELGVGRPFPPEIVEADRRRNRMVREQWRYLPDDPLPESPPVSAATIGTVLRAVRWRTRLSQRELAAAAMVPVSSVTRAEQAGGADLRLSTVEKVLGVCGLRLVVVDDEGTQLAVPYRQNEVRDRADRRLPAHRSRRTGRLRQGTGLQRTS